MKEHVQILKDKQIKSFFNGKVIVVGPIEPTATPLFCECCQYPMRTAEDASSYKRLGVCHKCDNRWSGHKYVTWPEGPDKSSTEWQEYLASREITNKPIFVFK